MYTLNYIIFALPSFIVWDPAQAGLVDFLFIKIDLRFLLHQIKFNVIYMHQQMFAFVCKKLNCDQIGPYDILCRFLVGR
jgi:hypothetical protein